MIEAKIMADGCITTEISGDTVDALEELAALIRSFRDVLSKQGSKEFADISISFAGKYAYADDEKSKEEAIDEYEKMLDALEAKAERKMA